MATDAAIGRLQKKWRDHKPDGKQSTKTGNQDTGDDVKDETFSIIQQYFSKKPGCGSTLGEATDDVPDAIEANGEGGCSDSCSDGGDRVSKKLKFDVPQKPITPGERDCSFGAIL